LENQGLSSPTAEAEVKPPFVLTNIDREIADGVLKNSTISFLSFRGFLIVRARIIGAINVFHFF